MSGERNLEKLISSMDPQLCLKRFIFFSTKNASLTELASKNPVSLFQEEEGITAIFSQEQAEELGLKGEGPYCRITLQVHSSLEAVGLTAAVAAALAEQGIPANVVAAYFHDHVFVPAEKAHDAVAVLKALANARSCT